MIIVRVPDGAELQAPLERQSAPTVTVPSGFAVGRVASVAGVRLDFVQNGIAVDVADPPSGTLLLWREESARLAQEPQRFEAQGDLEPLTLTGSNALLSLSEQGPWTAALSNVTGPFWAKAASMPASLRVVGWENSGAPTFETSWGIVTRVAPLDDPATLDATRGPNVDHLSWAAGEGGARSLTALPPLTAGLSLSVAQSPGPTQVVSGAVAPLALTGGLLAAGSARSDAAGEWWTVEPDASSFMLRVGSDWLVADLSGFRAMLLSGTWQTEAGWLATAGVAPFVAFGYPVLLQASPGVEAAGPCLFKDLALKPLSPGLDRRLRAFALGSSAFFELTNGSWECRTLNPGPPSLTLLDTGFAGPPAGPVTSHGSFACCVSSDGARTSSDGRNWTKVCSWTDEDPTGSSFSAGALTVATVTGYRRSPSYELVAAQVARLSDGALVRLSPLASL